MEEMETRKETAGSAESKGNCKEGESLSQLIKGGLGPREDLNCAETILYGANQAYGMKLDKQTLKLAAGFGGGMGVESTCGALTGGVMVLSSLFIKDRGHESDYVKGLCKEFFGEFQAALGNIDCTPLKEAYRTEKEGCLHLVARTAELLEKIIDREMANRVE